MNIFYLISVIMLLITVILMKKVNKKINFIGSVIVTIVVFMCYEAIVAYFLDSLKIPITLLNMGLINSVIVISLWLIICLKIKKFQSYTIKKSDVLFFIILLVVNMPILYKEFGLLQNFRYISTDSVMHCQAAITFSKSDSLLDSVTNWEAISPTFMIGSYVNDGMLMKALVNWIGEFDLYKVYMFTDVSYYFMIGYIFYLLITSYEKCNTKLKKILAYVISILFLVGYPLNSIITGFHYFTLGILQFITILYIINVLYKENIKLTCILLFLLNAGIILTYNLLAPIIYLAEFIYFVYEIRIQKKKLISKKNLLGFLTVFIIPGVIGLSFFFVPRILGGIKNPQQICLDGYIYINYFSNMILFIPFALYYIFKTVKENKLDVEIITFLTISIFMSLLLIGLLVGYVSVYYFMKPYFVLNAILFILLFKALCEIIDNVKIGKVLATAFVGLYCTILGMNLLFVNVGPYDFRICSENATKMFDIYNSNKSVMKLIQNTFTYDRIDALKYIYDNKLIEDQNLLYLGDHIDNFLFKLFFTYENREGIEKRKYHGAYSKMESRAI